jgi:hypothetical protein
MEAWTSTQAAAIKRRVEMASRPDFVTVWSYSGHALNNGYCHPKPHLNKLVRRNEQQ